MRKIVLGISLIFILSLITYKTSFALFNSNAKSSNNTFAAAAEFATPTPTSGPIPSFSPSISPNPSLSPSVSPIPTPIIGTTLVINEILPASSCSSGNTQGQYLELWNNSGSTVNLKNFKLSDGATTIDVVNANTDLPNGSFAVLVKSTGIINQCLENISNTAIPVNLGGDVNLNTGTLQLLDSDNVVIDTLKWGSGQDLQPSVNQAIERNPLGHDSVTGTNFLSSDFVVRTQDTPGFQTP